MEFVTICFILVVAWNVECKEMPNNIKDILKYRVTDMKSFIKAFNLQQEFSIDEDSTYERNFGEKVVTLEDQSCRPRPEVVEVTQPEHGNAFFYPYHIIMYRCSGSCGANPFSTTCTSVVRETVKVRVADISWIGKQDNDVSISSKVAHVSFQNDSRCACKCNSQQANCNQYQIWDEQSCKCKCVHRCPPNFIKDPNICCRCLERLSCTGKRYWDQEKCSCSCKKKKLCKVRSKVRDPVTCKCRCPFVYCRYGSVMDPHTCLCKDRND